MANARIRLSTAQPTRVSVCWWVGFGHARCRRGSVCSGRSGFRRWSGDDSRWFFSTFDGPVYGWFGSSHRAATARLCGCHVAQSWRLCAAGMIGRIGGPRLARPTPQTPCADHRLHPRPPLRWGLRLDPATARPAPHHLGYSSSRSVQRSRRWLHPRRGAICATCAACSSRADAPSTRLRHTPSTPSRRRPSAGVDPWAG